MALYKRGKTWWADFSVNGQRYRESLGTSDWREAQSRLKESISQATQGKIAPSSQQFAKVAFSEAADRYCVSRQLELSPRSLMKERQLLVKPKDFFGSTVLTRLTAQDLERYRIWRIETAGPSYVNMEMGVIRRILKRAKRWHLIGEDLRPLKEKRSPGRALSQDEKNSLLKAAASRPEWEVARCAAVIALNTTMRGCELKCIRWRDVDLLQGLVTVLKSKTEAGERTIPLNSNAMAAILTLYKRAQVFNAAAPEHYIFPACENGKIDPTRAQVTWRTAWRKLTRAIECPGCGKFQNPGRSCQNPECGADISSVRSSLEGLRFHDLRHHAITELAESKASEQTIMSIAGHVSPRMLRRYSHPRLEAKRTALEALAAKVSESCVTDHVTNTTSQVPTNPQVIEMNGRLVGTRTPDLHRVKVAL